MKQSLGHRSWPCTRTHSREMACTCGKAKAWISLYSSENHHTADVLSAKHKDWKATWLELKRGRLPLQGQNRRLQALPRNSPRMCHKTSLANSTSMWRASPSPSVPYWGGLPYAKRWNIVCWQVLVGNAYGLSASFSCNIALRLTDRWARSPLADSQGHSMGIWAAASLSSQQCNYKHPHDNHKAQKWRALGPCPHCSHKVSSFETSVAILQAFLLLNDSVRRFTHPHGFTFSLNRLIITLLLISFLYSFVRCHQTFHFLVFQVHPNQCRPQDGMQGVCEPDRTIGVSCQIHCAHHFCIWAQGKPYSL